VPRRNCVTGGWGQLCNKEFHKRWSGHVAFTKQVGSAYKIFIGKPERKRPHGRHRHRLEDNIKMDLKEV
jgi:hypothetical protein